MIITVLESGVDLWGSPTTSNFPAAMEKISNFFQNFIFSTIMQLLTFSCTHYCEILRPPLARIT